MRIVLFKFLQLTQVHLVVFLEWKIKFYEKINKKYAEIMHQADIAVGRKRSSQIIEKGSANKVNDR